MFFNAILEFCPAKSNIFMSLFFFFSRSHMVVLPVNLPSSPIAAPVVAQPFSLPDNLLDSQTPGPAEDPLGNRPDALLSDPRSSPHPHQLANRLIIPAVNRRRSPQEFLQVSSTIIIYFYLIQFLWGWRWGGGGMITFLLKSISNFLLIFVYLFFRAANCATE